MVQFASYLRRVLSKTRLIFPRINGPIEGKHVPFQRYVITPEEREEIENDKQLPSYSRAFAQDARRSKCIAMLNNTCIRNPRSSCLF